jgi:outer membrane translocation and assembly module TamA
MCFAQPQAPNIVYQGPSDAEIEANRVSLDQYRSQMGQQQADFQKQLQAQIDKANQDTENLQKQYEADAAAAAAAAAAQQTGSYAVTASQTAPVNAQTTAATTKKEKPKSTLKISTGGVAASAGSGLNIGV